MFAERLKECRKQKGVTQKAVAKYLGINKRSYQNYEYKNIEASYAILIKLADYFEISTGYLIGHSDDPKMY